MSPKHVLVVDDEEAICWSLRRALEQEGYGVSIAASAEEAFTAVAGKRPDAIILDVRLPGLDGLSALARLREQAGNAPVIVVTAYGNLTTAVRALEGGAFEYLAKPFDLGQALEAVTRALAAAEHQPEPGEPGTPAAGAQAVADGEEIIGQSAAMQMVFKRIALVASREACVLITGESGTGKELVARAIHRHSLRRERPFLPVHVAALNPSLVESELFGHVKGAFTGAAQSRPGLFALGEGGTIFLDEVADIPLAVQVKLLRALEHNEILPVGGNQPQALNLRILAATHQDLARKVADGSFRHDLFFRLNVFQIHLPPLRERIEDIPILAAHFLRRFEPRTPPLTAETIRFLQQLPWFGNVRELRNALEHAAIIARGGPLRPEHFPRFSSQALPANASEQLGEAVRAWLADRLQPDTGSKPADLYAELLRCVEPPLFAEVIRRVAGNRWEAGRWLGLNRATVRKKLGEFGLENES
jgi:two-component system nitrogen regulation response regulator GlnG